MKGWKEVQLRSITSKIGSGVTPKGGASVYIDKGTALIRSQNIYNGSFEYKGLVFVNEITAYKMRGVEIFKNDILINITGDSVARCTIVPDNLLPARVNQHVAIIRCKEDVDSAFVMYCLTSPIYQAKLLSIATGAGATRNALTKVILEDFKINLPPLPIQLKVSSILSTYDNLIENHLKRIKLLEELVQRSYEELFVKFRINGKQLKLNKETGLPEGWEEKPMNIIVEIISGFPFKSTEYINDGKYKIVTIKNVQDGYFVPITTDTLAEVPLKVKSEQKLETGDIIVSLTGNVGRICLVYGENYLLNQRVAKLIPRNSSNKCYTYSMLRSKSMITKLENISNGAAQQNLSPINMGNMTICIPSKDILSQFSKSTEGIIEMICNLNLYNSRLKESRDILLTKLMSGVIEVK